jgi:glycosyltransferase involved in cell wall biosynthesis
MRILLTVASLAREFGGPVEVATGLLDALRREGDDVRLIGAGDGPLGEGLPVLTTFRGTPIPGSVARVRSAVLDADIVHVLGYRDPIGVTAARAAVKAGVPYLVEPSGMHRARLRSVNAKRAYEALIGRWMISRAASVVATSELERRELIEDGVPPHHIRVRWNGLRLPVTELPDRGRIRERLDIPHDAPLVLALGRIARKKGLLSLTRAASSLSGVHLLVAGPDARDGTLRELETLVRDASLDDRVHVVDEGLWENDKLAAFADADCFALPSLTENFGIAAAEAAAAGVPVIVSDACGVAELLDPTGHRVVEPGDVPGLATAIATLVFDVDARRSAEDAAPELRRKLDWSSLVRDQRRLYEEALSS